MDVQLCECAKTPLIIHLKGWILYYINYELYMNIYMNYISSWFWKKKEERNNLKEISHSLKIKVLWKRQQILQNTKNFGILILSSGIISNAGIYSQV